MARFISAFTLALAALVLVIAASAARNSLQCGCITGIELSGSNIVAAYFFVLIVTVVLIFKL